MLTYKGIDIHIEFQKATSPEVRYKVTSNLTSCSGMIGPLGGWGEVLGSFPSYPWQHIQRSTSGMAHGPWWLPQSMVVTTV